MNPQEEGHGNPKKQYTLTESGTRLAVWTDGSAFHEDMPLVAGAGVAFARQSKGNTHFALNAQMEALSTRC